MKMIAGGKRRIVTSAALGLLAVVVGSSAMAHHRWSTYHWARTSDKIRPPVGNNVSLVWKPYLDLAIDGKPTGEPGWNDVVGNFPAYIESTIVAGGTSPKNCKPVIDRIEVCSSAYGRTGWLGVAQIWLSNGHITQAITKLNDTYFKAGSQYDTPAWRSLVMCQELGHDYGLGHNDETFQNYNNGTCMDYTNAPQGGVVSGFDYGPHNMYPNAHDFEELHAIYQHTNDGGTQTATKSEAAGGDTPSEWGRAIDFRTDGRPHVFEKITPTGARMITHVFWAHGEGPRPHRD